MIGSRLEIKEERAYNDLLNVFAYVALLIPPNFLFCLFCIGLSNRSFFVFTVLAAFLSSGVLLLDKVFCREFRPQC